MRRPNGSGTTYKLQGNRSRPWIARASSWDEDGRRVWRTLGYYATKTEAEKALLHIDELPTRLNVTFERVYEEWSESHFKRIDEGTVKNYKSIYNKLGLLYKLKFSQIRTAQLQSVIDRIAKDAPSRVLIAKALLTQMYDYALKNDICVKNYAQFIELPRREKPNKSIYTDAEIAALKKDGSETAKMLLMLIYSGMRVNEMLKLTVFDINLKSRTIVGGSKTEKGKNRTIPIHSATLDYWRGFVSDAEDGKLFRINYRTFLTRVYALQEKLGISAHTIHETRHTCASLLAREGVPPVIIQKILGHSDYATTANVYTHMDVSVLLESINKI